MLLFFAHNFSQHLIYLICFNVFFASFNNCFNLRSRWRCLLTRFLVYLANYLIVVKFDTQRSYFLIEKNLVHRDIKILTFELIRDCLLESIQLDNVIHGCFRELPALLEMCLVLLELDSSFNYLLHIVKYFFGSFVYNSSLLRLC